MTTKSIAAALLIILLLPIAAGGADYNSTFYVAPIYEVARDGYDSDKSSLNDLRARLGTGGEYAKVGFTAVSRYMNETLGKSQDFAFDPTLLRNILNLSVDLNFPVLIVLNGGPWGDVAVPENPEVNLIDYLEQWPENSQWRDDNTVPSDNAYAVGGLGRILTFNNYNSTVHNYRKRNFQAAVQEIYSFYQSHHDLFVGITIDPEVFMNPYYYSDYNPQTIQEFRDHLKRKYGTISAFNRAMRINLATFDQIDPPRPSFGHALGGNPLGEEWTDFRAFLVDNEVQRQVNWAKEVGLPAERVYTHQTVRTDNPVWSRYVLASPLYTAHVEGGSLGITTLQDTCFDSVLFDSARNLGGNWGIFEYNPTKPSGTAYQTYISALQLAYEKQAHVLSPYTWSQESNEIFYNIKGTAFETAIRDFVAQKAGVPFRASASGGTGEIYGKVISATTRRAIPGTAVRINSSVMPTNAAGEFRFTLVHPGIYTLYYDAPSYRGQTQVIQVSAVTRPPTVILSPGTRSASLGEIYGKVISATTRRAIPGTAVRINSSVMPTNGAGEFRFTLVHPGIYTLYYDAPSYRGQTQVIQVNGGVVTRPPMAIMSPG
jgi:hypothetical protein